MAKFTMLTLAALAVMAPFAAAKNCQQAYNYCGSSLLTKGNYASQIDDALHADNLPSDGDHVRNTLFACLGGPNGDIRVINFCDHGCHDGGKNSNDACL